MHSPHLSRSVTEVTLNMKMLISDGTRPPTVLTGLLSNLLLSCLVSSDPPLPLLFLSLIHARPCSAPQFGTFRATVSRLPSPRGCSTPSPRSAPSRRAAECLSCRFGRRKLDYLDPSGLSDETITLLSLLLFPSCFLVLGTEDMKSIWHI